MVTSKYQREIRAALLATLAPYERWIETSTQKEEVEAREILITVLNTLRDTRPDRRYRKGRRGHMSYLTHLLLVEQPLRRREYVHACHELIDLIYFHSVQQKRVLYNLITLLSEYVEG